MIFKHNLKNIYSNKTIFLFGIFILFCSNGFAETNNEIFLSSALKEKYLSLNSIMGNPVFSSQEKVIQESSETENKQIFSLTKAPLEYSNLVEVQDPVDQYGLFEITFNLNKTFSGQDLFNPDVIDVNGVFTSPLGVTSVIPAFWNQDYIVSNPTYESYTATGSPHWKIRFAPSEAGVYSYYITMEDSEGLVQSGVMTFTSNTSSGKGFVRVNPSNTKYMKYDNGEDYIPMGPNVAFMDTMPDNLDGTAYQKYFYEKLGPTGVNWTRFWMADFSRNCLEWSSGHWSYFYDGIGIYSLKAAYRVEKIIESARDNGIAMQLVINYHGAYSSWVNARWDDNPYNADNGGPVPADEPQEFFTNSTAKDFHKRRLRYIVARYGAYTNILCWELFNEVQYAGKSGFMGNWTNSFTVRSNITDWHDEMADYLKSIDPFQHLVTTSSDRDYFSQIWNLDNIDLVQIHDYSDPSSDRDISIREWVDDLRTHGKPVLVAETGGDDEDGFNTSTYTGTTNDKNHMIQGTTFHNAIWAGALSESCAANWWWGNYLEADSSSGRVAPDFPLYDVHYPPLKLFLSGETMADYGLSNSSLTKPSSVEAFGLASSERAFVWVRDGNNALGSGYGPGNLSPTRTMSGITITIPELSDQEYQIDIYDPWSSSAPTSSFETVSGGSGLSITLPDFQKDTAFKVYPKPASINLWLVY